MHRWTCAVSAPHEQYVGALRQGLLRALRHLTALHDLVPKRLGESGIMEDAAQLTKTLTKRLL